MNLSLHIARRYLFAKKTHNAINVISLISLVGVALGSMALVIVLSVYNGFDDLLANMYSGFNPEIKVTSAEGRYFTIDEEEVGKLNAIEGIETYSLVLETQALVRYKDKQSPCIIKGVDEQYVHVSNLDSALRRGEWNLQRGHLPGTVMGYALARTIGAGIKYVAPLVLYVPKRTGRMSVVDPSKSFVQQRVYPNGVFVIDNGKIDENYMILPIKKVRELLNFQSEISALEIKVKEGYALLDVQKQVTGIFGKDSHYVKNQQEQEASLFRMMKTEKWMTYLILTFILLIAAFNVIGTMSMLMLDKKNDMITLRNMGATEKLIRRIFLFEGWMISLAGASIGLLLGGILSYIQIKFGIISMGYGFMVDAYPLVVKLSDFVITFATVSLLGFFVAYFPVRFIKFQ